MHRKQTLAGCRLVSLERDVANHQSPVYNHSANGVCTRKAVQFTLPFASNVGMVPPGSFAHGGPWESGVLFRPPTFISRRSLDWTSRIILRPHEFPCRFCPGAFKPERQHGIGLTSGYSGLYCWLNLLRQGCQSSGWRYRDGKAACPFRGRTC